MQVVSWLVVVVGQVVPEGTVEPFGQVVYVGVVPAPQSGSEVEPARQQSPPAAVQVIELGHGDIWHQPLEPELLVHQTCPLVHEAAPVVGQVEPDGTVVPLGQVIVVVGQVVPEGTVEPSGQAVCAIAAPANSRPKTNRHTIRAIFVRILCRFFFELSAIIAIIIADKI